MCKNIHSSETVLFSLPLAQAIALFAQGGVTFRETHVSWPLNPMIHVSIQLISNLNSHAIRE